MTILSPSLISHKISYINHISHIANIPNPEQIQYLNFTHSIAWTFPKEKKLIESKDDILYTPSPDKYKVQDISIKSPTWSIHPLSPKKTNKFQGIFDYKLKPFFGIEGPKYTFRPKYDEDGITEGKRHPRSPIKTLSPGPGSYNIKDSKTSHYFWRKNQKKKNKANIEKRPDMCTYNLTKLEDWKIPCYTFGKELRKNLAINEESLKYNKGISKLRLDMDNINSTKTPKWSLYKIDRFINNKKKPKSAKNIFNIPGPGFYSMKTFIGEGPKYSFNKDKNNHSDPEEAYLSEKNKNLPGPTTYYQNMHYSPSGPLFSISKLKRRNIENDKYILSLPGPYSYNPNKTCTSGWRTFPKWTIQKLKINENEKKNEEKNLEKELGPGKYKYKSDIGLGPKYTFGKKIKKLKKFRNPGPGSYNIKTDTFNGPKYTIGLKIKEEENKNYNNKKAPLILNIPSDIVNNKGFTFPKEEKWDIITGIKNKKNKNIFPGPGDYKIPTSFDYINSITREKGIFDPKYKYV